MGKRNTVPSEVREAIEAELLQPRVPPRSRAAIAREHAVSARTVSRYAEELGIEPADVWRTDTIREATVAATDRRRAQRSNLADHLLAVEVPRLLERMGGQWHRTVVVPGPAAGTERVDEDDAVIARGLKDLHAAVKTAVDQTITIDKTDTDNGDEAAREALGRMFAGLDEVYERVQHERRHPDESEPPT